MDIELELELELLYSINRPSRSKCNYNIYNDLD
jgi:hypothetical protein